MTRWQREKQLVSERKAEDEAAVRRNPAAVRAILEHMKDPFRRPKK